MTHVVHPYAQRLGIIRGWKSRWFAGGKDKYRENVRIDAAVRKFLEKALRGMYVADIEIERGEKDIRVIVNTSRPGLVIGRSGENATKVKKQLEAVIRKEKPEVMPEVKFDVVEVKSPESNAAVVAYMITEGLEKRLPFRRVMKQTVEKVMANRDVQGVRIVMSGRLGGADMARKEELKKGRIPLQTFRADIDFAYERANLPYGVIGIKVWIYRGDIFEDKN
ncbi:MAG: 30S ribosomal protein S3 [Patescibacteria group bacterium UBA2103]